MTDDQDDDTEEQGAEIAERGRIWVWIGRILLCAGLLTLGLAGWSTCDALRASGRVPGHHLDHRLEGVHTASAYGSGGVSVVLFLLSYGSYTLASFARRS